MRISRSPQSFHWEHSDFGLRGLFLRWCGKRRDVEAVGGSWVKKWLPSTVRSLTAEWLVADGVDPEHGAPVWVGSEGVRRVLEASGYTGVRTIGMPAIYVPEWTVKRVAGSVLVLVSEAFGDAGGILGDVEVFAREIRNRAGGQSRVTVCVGEAMYAEREWVWRMRFQGVEVVCFEENPLSVDSLVDASVLFGSYEYVSGDTPGHWVAHAALRGAKVSIRGRGNLGGAYFSPDVLPGWLYGDVFAAPLAVEWGRFELGWEYRLSPDELGEAFGWSGVSGPVLNAGVKLGLSETLELAPRQVVEEALGEGFGAEFQMYLEGTCEGELPVHFAVPLALLRIARGDVGGAARGLEASSGAETGDIASVVLLGDVFCHQGRLGDAGALLSKALQKKPTHPALLLSLGAFVEGKGSAISSQEMFAVGLDLARDYGTRVAWPQYSRGAGRGRVLLVSCTPKTEAHADELLIVKSFRANFQTQESRVDLEISFSNTLGLPEVYNARLAHAAAAGYEYVVFVHDDAYVDDARMLEKLEKTHRECGFHVMGVAGAARADLKGPGLWHWMAPKEEWRGTIFNVMKKFDGVMASGFGPSPAPALFVDGVFMAVHVPSVMAVGWGFNESFRFHHYDLAACLDAKAKGLSVGVAPIHVIHDSMGLASVKDPVWKASDDVFSRLYGKRDA